MAQISLYFPDSPPVDSEGLPEYLLRELTRISGILEILSSGQIDEVNTEPAKPRIGMIRLADGVNWNPGLGPGYYIYLSGAWHKLTTTRISSPATIVGKLTYKGGVPTVTSV